MAMLNKYKVTFNNQECRYVEANDFDVVGGAIVFIKNKNVNAACFAGIYKEKILLISGAEVMSIELVYPSGGNSESTKQDN